MGYQESWLYISPAHCFDVFVSAYVDAREHGYYSTAPIPAVPLSVVTLKEQFGGILAGAKVLWICGERGYHSLPGVFGEHLSAVASHLTRVKFLPVETLLDENDRRLTGIDFDSDMPTENVHIRRESVDHYAEHCLQCCKEKQEKKQECSQERD